MATREKVKLATIWLEGCSGCHMSFLDQDELLIELAKKAEVVYSPIADTKVFPKNVDITLVEGAVGNQEQLNLLKKARTQTKILVSLGDCAVTGNVSALRNSWSDSAETVLKQAYLNIPCMNPQIPKDVPKPLKQVCPLHEVVKVDYFIPGCPPSASLINY